MRSARMALTMCYVAELCLMVTENGCPDDALRHTAFQNFQRTFIINVKSLRCVALRYRLLEIRLQPRVLDLIKVQSYFFDFSPLGLHTLFCFPINIVELSTNFTTQLTIYPYAVQLGI